MNTHPAPSGLSDAARILQGLGSDSSAIESKCSDTTFRCPARTALDYPALRNFSPVAPDALGGGRDALKNFVGDVLEV